MMTVKDLINVLKNFDENLKVVIEDSEIGETEFADTCLTVTKSSCYSGEDVLRICGYVTHHIKYRSFDLYV